MKTLTAALILSLILSSQPIQCAWASQPADATAVTAPPSNPKDRIYRISPEEYEQIKPLLQARAAQGSITITQVADAGPIPTNSVATEPATTNVPAEVTEAVHPTPSTNSMVIVAPPPPHVPPPPHRGIPQDASCSCDGFDGLVADLGNSDWSSGDGAIVIFVVVGVVVVLSVVVYAGAFIYQALLGSGDIDYWWDVEGYGSILFGKESDGYMTGARLCSGLTDSAVRVGLVLEAGHIDTDVVIPPTVALVNVKGTYGMAGAGVRWNVGGYENNPSFLGIELLGGTASSENVDLMSAARATVSFGMTEHTRVGFSVGALYMGLASDDGILDDVDNFSTTVGMQAGYRF